MNTNTQTQIANFLNVSPNQIKSIKEMAWVYCVVVHGCKARFVSKKVVVVEMKEELSVLKMLKIGSRWTKHGKDRIYFESSEIAKILDLSNSKARQIAGGKFYYDMDAEEFFTTASKVWGATMRDEWVSAIQKECTVTVPATVAPAQNNAKPFPNAMMTSTGQWVSPEEWDDIEAAM